MKKSFAKARRVREDGQPYKHDLGQHFLYDEALLCSLVASTGVTKADGVLEIGPGSGMLTACLCKAAKHVVAVEADESLLPFLRVKLEPFPNVTLVSGDIRKQDLFEICRELPENFLVVANVPYSITTPIFEMLWQNELHIRQISVMIQKEVAEKLIAGPSDAAYGLLSIKCQYYCEPKIEQIIPAAAFTPPPKVDSAFVHLVMRQEPPLPVDNESLFFRLVKAGFGMRRKTLANALRGAIPLDQSTLKDIFESLGFSPTVRGEALSVQEWIRLANACQRAAK